MNQFSSPYRTGYGWRNVVGAVSSDERCVCVHAILHLEVEVAAVEVVGAVPPVQVDVGQG